MINKKLNYLFALSALVFSTPRVTAQEATNETPIAVVAENLTNWERLMRAYESRKEMPQGRLDNADDVEDLPADIALMRAYTDANTELLSIVNELLKNPLRRPPLGTTSKEFIIGFTATPKLREISRLMQQHGRVQAADGDLRGALQTDLNIITLGVQMQHGGTIVDSMFGGGIESLGRTNLRRNLPRFDAVLAREAAKRLLAIDASHPNYADVVRGDKLFGLATLDDVFRADTWQAFRKNGDATAYFGKDFDPADAKELLATTDETIRNGYIMVVDAAIERAGQPYDNTLAPIKPPADTLSRMMSQLYLQNAQPPGRTIFERNRNSNFMLAIAFALRSYYVENEEYPANLSQLVPQHLDAIPFDPFDPSEPLRYRRTPEGYVLYSIGPDGIDNNGKPTFIDDEPKAPMSPDNNAQIHAVAQRNYYSIRDESKGDIVFGINN